MVLVSLLGACSSDESDDGSIVERVWEGTGDLFDGLVLWGGLFLLSVIVAAAVLILPATWLRRRFSRSEDPLDS